MIDPDDYTPAAHKKRLEDEEQRTRQYWEEQRKQDGRFFLITIPVVLLLLVFGFSSCPSTDGNKIDVDGKECETYQICVGRHSWGSCIYETRVSCELRDAGLPTE